MNGRIKRWFYFEKPKPRISTEDYMISNWVLLMNVNLISGIFILRDKIWLIKCFSEILIGVVI
jgi:hypothetical protein